MADNPLTNIIRFGFTPRGTPSGPQTLTAPLVTNSNTFFAPTVSQPGGTATDFRHETRIVYGLNHSFVRFGRQPVGQAGAGAQTLSPSLFTNQSTFYPPTITGGAVTITPQGSGRALEFPFRVDPKPEPIIEPAPVPVRVQRKPKAAVIPAVVQPKPVIEEDDTQLRILLLMAA